MKNKEFMEAYEKIKNAEGKAVISDMEKALGKNKTTIKRFIDKKPGFSRDDNGCFYYTEQTD